MDSVLPLSSFVFHPVSVWLSRPSVSFLGIFSLNPGLECCMLYKLLLQGDLRQSPNSRRFWNIQDLKKRISAANYSENVDVR